MSILNIYKECIMVKDNKYYAIFGYENKHNYIIEIPLGLNNHVNIAGNFNIPTKFYPGNHNHSFIIPFTDKVTWSINYNNEISSDTIDKDTKNCDKYVCSNKKKKLFTYKPFAYHYISGVPIHKIKLKL